MGEAAAAWGPSSVTHSVALAKSPLAKPSLKREAKSQNLRSKKDRENFPGGPVVTNPPANAGLHRFNHWSWKDPTYCGTAKPRGHNY